MKLDFSIKGDKDKFLTKIKTAIKEKVIKSSLDKILKNDVIELKKSLKQVIKNKVEIKDLEGKAVTLEDPNHVNKTINKTPVSVEEQVKRDILKHLGVDIDKIPNTPYTTTNDGNVLIMKDGFIKFRSPVSPYSNYETEQSLVLERFRNSIIFDPNTGNFYKPTSKTAFPKPECSNKAGDHERSKDVFESRKNSKNQRRLTAIDKTGIGPFVTWTLFKNDLDNIVKDSINLKEITQAIIDGKHDEILKKLGTISNINETVTEIKEKIEILKQNKDTVPGVKSFQNINTLIDNLKLKKTLDQDSATYSLISNYDEDETNRPFLEEIIRQIGIWKGAKEKLWINAIINRIIIEIKKILKDKVNG